MNKYIVLFIILLSSKLAWSESNISQQVEQGLQAYNQKEFDKAQNLFEEALKQDPENQAVLSNLALVQVQKQNYIMAYALWRKAQTLGDTSGAAKEGITYLQKKNLIKTPPSSDSFWEDLAISLQSLSSYTLYLLSLLLFVLTFRSLLKYLGKRRESLVEEKKMPSAPILTGIFALLFIACLSCTLSKVYWAQKHFAIIIADTSARLYPKEDGPELYTVLNGEEVEVFSRDKDWIQIESKGKNKAWILEQKAFLLKDL
jgi:tetratricopeptide (TPR) repeat protein